MLGIQTEQKELFSYRVDLDQRVRQDNPLRIIKERIDFSWVRQEVKDCYGYNGNVSVDPVVIVKMLLLLFLDNVKSERELMRIIPERLDYLWFLGFGLDDETPDHSVLSKARARWGREVFEKIFVRTVWECVRLGLVEGKKIHADSSLVDANAAAARNIVNGPPEWIAALKEAYAVEEEKLERRSQSRKKSPKHKTALSLTDPDAPLAAQNNGGAHGYARPRYKHHRVVDDRHGVITAVQTTGGTVHESHCLLDLTRGHEENTGMTAEAVVADAQYGTRHNFRVLQAMGKKTHMGVLLLKGKGVFHRTEFAYDSQTDTYRCPAGQTLTRRGYNPSEDGWQYRADKKICGVCPIKEKCFHSTTPGYTRVILRPEGDELIQQGHEQALSPSGKKDRRRRMTLIEGSFGVAAQNHGFKRSRWRRLWRQQIQDCLIATVQNIKIILKHSPKNAPAAAASTLASLFTQSTALGTILASFLVREDRKSRPFRSHGEMFAFQN